MSQGYKQVGSQAEKKGKDVDFLLVVLDKFAKESEKTTSSNLSKAPANVHHSDQLDRVRTE